MPDKSEQLKKAKKYGKLLLRYRPRSVNEFRDRLLRHGFSPQITDELTKDFKERGLLNDAIFAKLWTSDRMLFKPSGKIKLKEELAAKGVDESDIEKAINEITTDKEEYNTAFVLAEKRLRQIGGIDKITAKRRLFSFLERRGFSFEIIENVLERLF